MKTAPRAPGPRAKVIETMHRGIRFFPTPLALVLLLAAPAAAQPRVETRLTLSPGALSRAGALQMAGFQQNLTPGQPALPRRTLLVALHPDADLSTLTVRRSGGPQDTLPGSYRLRPNGPARLLLRGKLHLDWGPRRGHLRGGRDPAAYDPAGAALFPARTVSVGAETRRRGMRLLQLVHTPLRYRHATGELLLQRHGEVLLSYALRPGAASRPADPLLLSHLAEVQNRAQAAKWYAPGRADTAARPGYAVIIPEALKKASAQLAAFVQQKTALGYVVTVVGETELQTAKGVAAGASDAERVRAWLQQNYQSLGLKYVLLVGNPDTRRKGVPMVMTYPMATHHSYPTLTPSDYYFADLSGNWDLDGDGKLAEYPDDKGSGGVDFTPEVYVGRIPVYDDNVAALDKILQKTTAYIAEKGDRAWRRRVLQPAAMLFFEKQYNQNHIRVDGASMAEAIYLQAIKPAGLSRTTLYETAGVDPSTYSCDTPLTADNLVKEWQKGYGLVTWMAHGSATGAYRTVWAKDDGDKIPSYQEVSSPAFITYSDVLQLDDARPSIVFHGSCANGTPERADNIGYGLLLHGAVATVASSRDALVVLRGGEEGQANIFGVERDFTKLLLSGKSVGEALLEAKRTVSDTLGNITWYTRAEINLYGDPSITLSSCTTDAHCDDGKACNGKERCSAGQCSPGKKLSCTSADPCTVASCDDQKGCLLTPRPDGEACDDGKFCTVQGVCRAGVCQSKPRCAAPQNPCVSGVCDDKTRTCDVVPIAEEGGLCREGTAREGTCQAGLCRPQSGGGCAVAGGRSGAPGALGLLLLGLGLLWRRRRGRATSGQS